MPQSLFNLAEELRVLHIADGESMLALYRTAVEAECIQLADCLTLRDLLEISGLGNEAGEALHALLIALFAVREQGSVCLRLEKPALEATLQEFTLDPTGLAEEIRGKLQNGSWSPLVGREDGEMKPLILTADQRFLYFQKLFIHERNLRQQLLELTKSGTGRFFSNPAMLAQVVRTSSVFSKFSLNREQMRGVYLALRQRFLIISGGPGTGKTTLVAALLRALANLEVDAERVCLLAPTGRAAQRLGESVRNGLAQAGESKVNLHRFAQLEGTTVHRLLRYNPRRARFTHNQDNPVPLDFVIVDEVSMLDVFLMDNFLAALPPHASVVFLGDHDQLPSVSEGAILADLIPATRKPIFSPEVQAEFAVLEDRPSAPLAEPPHQAPFADQVVVLHESNRSAGQIMAVAKAMNAGDPNLAAALPRIETSHPDWDAYDNQCLLLDKPARDTAAFRAVLDSWLRTHYLTPKGEPPLNELLVPATGGDSPDETVYRKLFNRLDTARILALTRSGIRGVEGINEHLSQRFRRWLDPKHDRGELFSGAPVLITQNSRSRGLFNGDIGLVLRAADGKLFAIFRRNETTLRFPIELLPSHEIAFAMTVHKSQGSEFGNVLTVLPASLKHRLLTREIVYTAITRARRLAVICGREAALRQAVSSRIVRHSGLDFWNGTDSG